MTKGAQALKGRCVHAKSMPILSIPFRFFLAVGYMAHCGFDLEGSQHSHRGGDGLVEVSVLLAPEVEDHLSELGRAFLGKIVPTILELPARHVVADGLHRLEDRLPHASLASDG